MAKKTVKKFSEIGQEIGTKIDQEIEKEGCECGEKKNHWHHKGGGASGGNAVYGLGFIGALIYFIGHATSFWMGVLGVLKAIIWPVLLVYKALGLAGL
jgi:hypothetical protein